MRNVFIIGEHSGGKLKPYTIELCGKGRELAALTKGATVVVLFGEGAEKVAPECGPYGVSKVIAAAHTDLSHYSGEGYTTVLCNLITREKPSMVLASASSLGKDLLARAAMRLRAGLATDCVDLKVEGGKLKARRPIFAGKAQVDVMLGGELQMATSRPNTYPLPEKGSGSAEVIVESDKPGTIRAKVKELRVAERGMVDLTEADRIVSGGRSLGSADNFKIIRDLAESIGATVGASRAAVDAGYISHDHQVGQTGKTVNPSLYIACGISGAIQHLAGMRTSKVVVAINKDADAPIFSKADYGIVGDLFEVLPLLTQEFQKLLSE